MTAAVELTDLMRVFGPKRAVDGMSWAAPAARVTAILGPNGAGKTTAIECAVGLQRPDGGRVRVLGADPWHASPEHRSRVGVVLQSGGLPNGTTPMRLLHHVARLHEDPRDPDEVARLLGVDDFAATTVRRLSGGQRQRLGFATALVGRPEVLFLDEPTAGLDPHGRLDVWDLVARIAHEGAAVIVTTHSFEEAERLADHLVIVADGRTVAEGTPGQVAGDDGLESTYFSLTRKAHR